MESTKGEEFMQLYALACCHCMFLTEGMNGEQVACNGKREIAGEESAGYL
ncbi:hypothetical protein [Bacillus marinisedimentorum]|nr:hypothetical protein [Bacillus marinisedimentorum]